MFKRLFPLAFVWFSVVAVPVQAEGVLPVNYRPQYPYVSVYSYRNMQLWPELSGMYAPGARTPYNIGVQGGYSAGTHQWSAAFAPYGAQNHLQRTYVSVENPRNTQTTVEPQFTYAQGGATVGTAPWEMSRSGLSLRSGTTGTRTSGLRSAAGATGGASRFAVSSGGTSGFSVGSSRTTGSSFTSGGSGGSGFSFGSGNNSTGTSGGTGRFSPIGSLGQGNGEAVGFGNGDRSRGEEIFGPLPTYEQLFGS